MMPFFSGGQWCQLLKGAAWNELTCHFREYSPEMKFDLAFFHISPTGKGLKSENFPLQNHVLSKHVQWCLKHMARLFSLRCWDDPGTTGVYIQTYDIYIRLGNIISSAYTFLTTLHASDIQGLLVAGTPGPTANWKRCQVNLVGVLGTIALKCQILSSTPDRYLKLVIILSTYGTGMHRLHVAALVCFKRRRGRQHHTDVISYMQLQWKQRP